MEEVNKYNNSIIFMITSIRTGEKYIGCSINKIGIAISTLRQGSIKSKNLLYLAVDSKNWSKKIRVKILERVNCENRLQLIAIEQYYIDKLMPELNMKKKLVESSDKEKYKHDYYKTGSYNKTIQECFKMDNEIMLYIG